MVMAGGGYGGELRVEEEIGGNGGGSGRGGRGVHWVVAREVVDGGAYGLELAREVVGDLGVGGLVMVLLVLDVGGEMVERENVGGHHGHKKKKVQTHCEAHCCSLLLQ